MSRRHIVLIALFAVTGAALLGLMQWPLETSKKPFVVGILHPTKNDVETFEGFRSKLAALGYAEGADVVFEYDGPTGPGDKLTEAAQKMVRDGVDLIFASGTPAADAAKKAADGTNTAVVFGPVSNPVALGRRRDASSTWWQRHRRHAAELRPKAHEVADRHCAERQGDSYPLQPW